MTRQRTIRLPLLVALSLLALPACADQGGGADTSIDTDPAELTGITWRLVAGSIADLVPEAPADALVTIVFEDGKVGGTAACNSYFGTYEAGDDGSISIGELGQTEMACADVSLMALEAAYLDALSRVTTFGLEGLLGLSGEGVGLTFSEEMPLEPLPLTGTDWALDSLYSGDAVSSTIAGSEATMTLQDDGSVAGTTGCNRFLGTYATDGDRLSFSALSSTKMACDEGLMNQERIFLEGMAAVAAYAIEGERLTLIDAAGAPLLGFVGAAPASP